MCQTPKRFNEVLKAFHVTSVATARHLRELKQAGFLEKAEGGYHTTPKGASLMIQQDVAKSLGQEVLTVSSHLDQLGVNRLRIIRPTGMKIDITVVGNIIGELIDANPTFSRFGLVIFYEPVPQGKAEG